MAVKVYFFAHIKTQGLTEHMCNMALSVSKYAELLIVYDKRIERDRHYLDMLRANNIGYVHISELQEAVDSCVKNTSVLFHCNGFAHLRLAAKVARPIDRIVLSVHCFRNALWYGTFFAIATYLLFWRRVDLWHFLSHKSRQEYFWFRGIPGNTCVFPLGIEELFMRKAMDSPVIRDVSGKQIENFSNKKIIVYIARFQPWKHHIFLLESLAAILKGNVNLILIGEGPFFNKVKKVSERIGIRENVIFTGRIERKAVHSILSKANLAVAVTSSETFGWCVLEPFCMDVPVVASDIGIARDLIIDYYNGFILTSGCNREELLEKVKVALKHITKVDNSDKKHLYHWETFGNNVSRCYNSLFDNIPAAR